MMTAPTRTRCGAVVVSAALAIAIAVGAGGCSPRVLESSSELVVVLAAQGNGMEALLEGELTTTPGGCLAVRWGEPALVTMLAAAPGTRLDGPDAVVMPTYGRLELGQQVALGGGFASLDEEWSGLEVPAACGQPDEVFFVNSFG